MMPDYHVGTLDAESLTLLSDGAETIAEDQGSRPIFLQSKVWSKAVLSAKKQLSPDSKVFTFTLGHEAQTIGLPIGQHLMMRLRDPVTREAIIRAYTPLSEGTDKGLLDVLIKIYYDTPQQKGGKMTQALDSIPVGHFVEFKGPVGKFEYLGNGRCTIGGKEREVQKFIMICGGSGITPIFQVLRAVMNDRDDPTHCVVLDGNRIEQDILCKPELDAIAAANRDKCDLVYSLSKPGPEWTGRRGRMDKPFFETKVGGPSDDTRTMVLICGPAAMESSVRDNFLGLGWKEEDLLFF